MMRSLFLLLGAIAIGATFWIMADYNAHRISFEEMAWRSGVVVAGVLTLAAISAIVEYGPQFWFRRHESRGHGFEVQQRDKDSE